MMDKHFRLELDTPVRFLALAWSDDWEFGFPTIVLDPVVRYCAGGTGPEWLIEDVAEDLALDTEAGRAIDMGLHPADLDEFRWRGWSIDGLRRVAEDLVAGRALRVRDRNYRVVEKWITFTAGDGLKIEFAEAVSTAVF